MFPYRGGNLVRNGDAVVVTINYRLGALGFLGHRDLAGPDGHVGNWGIHDQLAALAWVRDNIAVFGGDPGNVTIFGESAGAFSVAMLLGTPAASGLFRRAVVQSGGVARAHGRGRGAFGGSSGGGAGCRIVYQGVARTSPGVRARRRHRGDREASSGSGMIPLPYLPVVDGVLLPEHPLAAVAKGSAAGIDLLIGTNRDELTLFGLGNPALLRSTRRGCSGGSPMPFPTCRPSR